MRFSILSSVLFSTVLAAPATAGADPEYGPGTSSFKIVKSSGNGCPGSNSDYRSGVVGTMWGGNDDARVFMWALNLPNTMGAAYFSDLPDEITRTCTHEWQLSIAEGYRWNVNTNGTFILARYMLPQGMTAIWKVTYYPPGTQEFTDEIRVKGPVNTVENPDTLGMLYSPISGKSFKTGCTSAEQIIKMKTEVTIEKDDSWVAFSGSVWGGYSSDAFQRIQQGLTYTWEKC